MLLTNETKSVGKANQHAGYCKKKSSTRKLSATVVYLFGSKTLAVTSTHVVLILQIYIGAIENRVPPFCRKEVLSCGDSPTCEQDIVEMGIHAVLI